METGREFPPIHGGHLDGRGKDEKEFSNRDVRLKKTNEIAPTAKKSSAVRNQNQMTRNPTGKLPILKRWKRHNSHLRALGQDPRKGQPKKTK